jgi:diaminopimelate epimerase
VIGDGIVSLRTYERGVEAETLACGTGSVAAGVVCNLTKSMQFPVSVNVRSGETLVVNADVEDGRVRKPTLEGSAHMVYTGHLQYDDSVKAIVNEWHKGARG